MIARERAYLWIIFAPITAMLLLAGIGIVLVSRIEVPPLDTSGGVVAVDQFLRGMAAGDAQRAARACGTSRETEIQGLLEGRPEVWGQSWRVPAPRLDDSLGWTVDLDMLGRDSRIRHFMFVLLESEGGWWISQLRIRGERHSLVPWVDVRSLPLTPEIELRSDPVARRGPDGPRLALAFRIRDGELIENKGVRAALLHVTLSARKLDGSDIFTAGAARPVPLAVDHRWQDFDAEIPVPERPSGNGYRLWIRVTDQAGGLFAEVEGTVTLP